jgi:hypothetical protein
MKRFLFAALFCLIAGHTYAFPAYLRTVDIGIIFNTDSLLLDYESYQGGIGAKLYDGPLAYRLTTDLYLSTISESRAITLGLGAEYHFSNGRVSPYAGGYVLGSFAKARDEATSQSWTETRTIDMGFGGILGVELFVTRFLSLFAEYDLGLTYSSVSTTESIAGQRNTTQTADWTLDLGVGNESKIGIVIYLYRERKMDYVPFSQIGLN